MKNKKQKQVAKISIIFILCFFLNSFNIKDIDEKYFIRFDKSFKPSTLEIIYNDSVSENYEFKENECLIDYKNSNPIYLKVIMKNKKHIIINNILQEYKLKGVFFEKSISNREESFVHIYYKTSDHGAMTSAEFIKFIK